MKNERQTQRYFEKRYDKNGRHFCLIPICNKIAEQYKNGRYRNYCKKHNWIDMQRFTNWTSLSKHIIRRDGKCVKCGDDRDMVEMYVNETDIFFRKGDFLHKGTRKPVRRIKQHVTNLQADHIVEIADGGNEWDENNLQTLCLKCHREKTKTSIKIRKIGNFKPLNNFKEVNP